LTPWAFFAARASLVRWEMALRSFYVQHKRIRVSAQFCHDEGRLMGHQTADEMDVATQPIELGNYDRRLVLPGDLQRRGELRPTIEGVRSFAGFDFLEGLDQPIAFRLRKPSKRRLLRLEPQARSALASGGNAGVGDGGFHGIGPPFARL